MELDFDKYCILDGSPTTVLLAPRRRSKVAIRKSNGMLKCGNDVTLVEDFIDNGIGIDIGYKNRYRSASCRDARSTRSNVEHNEVLKRGSVYQSSKEASLLKRNDVDVGRTKIEFSRGSNSTFSVGISVIDSLCTLDEDHSLVEEQRSSTMSISEQVTSSVCKNSKKYTFNPMIASHSSVSPINHGICPQERGNVNFHKSLSAKLALPQSPAQLESDSSKASSPKNRFTPVRKIFHPFVKSKSHKIPLSCAKENGRDNMTSEFISNHHKKTVCKSLQSDLSVKPHYLGNNSQFEMKENRNSVRVCSTSPAHLQALLKLENKHGVPFFVFSVNWPEDCYVAKTWKVENALTWVYTFHSSHHKRKSNASGWGFKDSNRESIVLGQMCASCYLHTELIGGGAFEDSMVTEFVLYDIAQSRKSTSSLDNSSSSPDFKALAVSDEILSWGNSEQNENSAKSRIKRQFKHPRESVHFESSTFQPLAASELHPELETAAIVMKVPLEKRESLKFKSGDREVDKLIPDLLHLCQLEQAREGILENSSPWRMHVVIPAGNHSLPSEESHGPSPLLKRWRLGGGCDCGGWDMACPLNVLGNPNIRIAEGSPLIGNHPSEVFFQGRKDTLPAFTMRAIEDGKYAVDFHAQLSSLQAFSICVAILHAAEASSAVGQERTKQMFQTDSLRVFPEEESKCFKNWIDATADEDKLKVKKKMEEVLPSFVQNPPFSPIARV